MNHGMRFLGGMKQLLSHGDRKVIFHNMQSILYLLSGALFKFSFATKWPHPTCGEGMRASK